MAVSRRTFIAGAGASLGTPTLAHASRPGTGSTASTGLSFMATVLRDGDDLTGFGWVTDATGLDPGELFTDPARRGADTARLRWHVEMRVDAVDVLPRLTSATGDARLRLCFANLGGAHDDDPATFATGRVVAGYRGALRIVETAISADDALVELSGTVVQGEVRRCAIGRLGGAGERRQLRARGSAVRTGAGLTNSARFLAGTLRSPSGSA